MTSLMPTCSRKTLSLSVLPAFSRSRWKDGVGLWNVKSASLSPILNTHPKLDSRRETGLNRISERLFRDVLEVEMCNCLKDIR